MPIAKVKGAISLFHLICDDGNFGRYHGWLIQLYLYLSRLQWERRYHDDAFASLDLALEHAKEFDSANAAEGSARIAESLPGDWPFWCNPDYSQAEEEMKADPRWAEWVERTKG